MGSLSRRLRQRCAPTELPKPRPVPVAERRSLAPPALSAAEPTESELELERVLQDGIEQGPELGQRLHPSNRPARARNTLRTLLAFASLGVPLGAEPPKGRR